MDDGAEAFLMLRGSHNASWLRSAVGLDDGSVWWGVAGRETGMMGSATGLVDVDVAVRLLGSVDVLVDGRRLLLVGVKQRAIVAMLALETGAVVSVDRLIDGIWGEDSPPSVRSSVQVHVSQVRRLFDERGLGGLIETRRPGYVLGVDPDRVDALRFSRLVSDARRLLDASRRDESGDAARAALGLWAGEALAGLDDVEFVMPVRTSLEGQRLEAAELAFAADLEAGRHEQVVGELDGWATMHPYRESLWQLLATALYRCGRQAEALERICALRRLLRDDLGLEISPPLAALELAILDQDLSLDPPASQRTVSNSRGARTNLPRPLSAMVAADRQLGPLWAIVAEHRLVTLIGPGGVGKTRLAVELGWSYQSEFADGVWIVDLAPLADPSGVMAAFASIWSIVPQSGMSLVEALVDWLGDRSMLLVVDNCEHLIDDVARLVVEVLERCPAVTVVATSREALGVAGERVHPVRSLDPDSEAVELFIERARAVQAVFDADTDRGVIVEICRRLDCIPLAIELAAARTIALGPGELLARLDDRFRLLRGQGRGGVDRHHTLRAAVSWSYQLLNVDEQTLFDRVSVFAGGFDLAAAEAVCGGAPLDSADVIDLVQSLVAKSMVVATVGPEGARYQLLETLRQFGEEQLDGSGHTASIHDRFLIHFVELTERLDSIVLGARQVEGSLLFDREWDNVRAAHGWAIATDDIIAAEHLVRTSWQHAQLRMLTEHADWAERTIALDKPDHRASTELFGIAADWVGGIGDEEHACRLARAGLARAKSVDDPSTYLCWYALDGAGPMPGEPDFGHNVGEQLRRAVERIDDLERNWLALADLVSVGMGEVESPRFNEDLDRLRRLASRVKAPALMIMTELISAHVEVLATPPDLASAHRRYSAGLELALATSDIRSQGWASRGVATTATALQRPDALTMCHEALLALADMRYWQKVWQTLDTTIIALLDSGRTREATTILGYLETQPPNIGLENWLGFRRSAIERTNRVPEASAWMQQGSEFTRDGIVDYALASTRPT